MTGALEGFVTRVLRLHWPRPAAVAFCGSIGILVPAAYGTVMGVPEPAVHDEFSYLLGADTFARGRLTNPTPPLPEFFEAPHILVVPSYNSKYPPGQALVLAAGQVLTGRPIWGVWLGCGLFAASLCWMLQAWSSREWALAITVLMVVTLGMFTYWAQSYWGGMVAASGGALLFGGMRRTLRAPRIGPSVFMALGVLLLANTRPYEGMLASIPPAVVLGHWSVRNRRFGVARKVKSFVLPACIVLVGGVMGMARYNRAVTGESGTTPYARHTEQYFHHGIFLFSALREPQRDPSDRVANFYGRYASPPVRGPRLLTRIAKNTTTRLLRALKTPFGIMGRSRLDHLGVFIWLTLLAALWCFRSTPGIALIAIAAVLVECVVWWWYVPLHFGLFAWLVIAAWVVTFYTVHRRDRWAWIMIGVPFLVVLGGSLVWWWGTHYAAPFVPLLLAAIATSSQRVARRSRVAASRRLGGLLVGLLAVHLVRIAAFDDSSERLRAARTTGLERRAAIVHRLEQQNGEHLVFVRYAPGFTLEEEWVYNAADLNAARVIFAHDLGRGRNLELMAAFPERSDWLLTVSRQGTQVEPYSLAIATEPAK